MIELSESKALAQQITENLTGKTIKLVAAAQSPHKFAWYHGDPAEYYARLAGNAVISAESHGMFVQVDANSPTLLFSDGVNLRPEVLAARGKAKITYYQTALEKPRRFLKRSTKITSWN